MHTSLMRAIEFTSDKISAGNIVVTFKNTGWRYPYQLSPFGFVSPWCDQYPVVPLDLNACSILLV